MKPTSSKLSYDILKLQNLIKRDPPSYYEEFLAQYQHYQSLIKLFLLKPQSYDPDLVILVSFLSQVANLYKNDLEGFPLELMNVLKQNRSILDPSMRMCFAKALVLMRNRGVVDAVELISLFFNLLRCKDKILRKYLQVHIVTDIKNMNLKHKNMKVNSVLQNSMFKMVMDPNPIAAKICLDAMIELYKKNVWKDVKTVNAIASACFSKVNKILVTACQFFLGIDEEEPNDSSDSEDDSNVVNVREVIASNKVNKKTRSRMKLLKRTKQVLKKSKKKSKDIFDFYAIHLLHDPQGMAEKLLKMLNGMNERYEIKMLVMNLISRLVGVHQLILLNFYALLIRYLKPHQREVTKILMFAAQAAHEYVPPDVLEPVVRAIADNFITERNSAEVMTVGINAIREISARNPFAISEDLLQDIAQYKKYRNKNVMMAARSLIQCFRKINPQMLKKKFRSRPTEASAEMVVAEFGALNAKSYIPGTEVLSVEAPNVENDEPADDEEDDDEWSDVYHSSDLSCEEEEDDNIQDNDYESDTPNISKDPSKNMDDHSGLASENSCIESTKSGKTASTKESDSKSVVKEDKAMLISQSRILSQEEFKKVKIAQIAKEVQFKKGKKRKAEESDLQADLAVNPKEFVSLRDIEKLHKRIKDDKETRLSTVLAGREDREKFTKKAKKNSNAGMTKKQQKRNKVFMMIKHKVQSKQKRSFKDKQISLRNALLKRRRNR